MTETMKLNGTYLEIDSKRNFSAAQKLIKLEEQNDKCAYCGTDVDLSSHGDHIFPHSKGGKTELDNLVIACPECNQKKKDMNPEEWESVSNDNLSLAA
jgi:5-methylcytosine-specific restriction endonuclease McrA